MAFPSQTEIETLKRVAEVSGWTLPDNRMPEVAEAFRAIAEDTRLLRAAELCGAVPAGVFEAE